MPPKIEKKGRRTGSRSSSSVITEGALNAPRLYKYRSLSKGKDRKRTLQIIEKSELWYSKASAFNDPFDCNHMISEKTADEVAELVGDFIDSAKEGARTVISNLFQEVLPEKARKILQPPKKNQKKKQGGVKLTIKDKNGRILDPGDVFNKLQERRMKRFYQLLDESFGVLSLSEKPDDILLWAHYANGHDGLCLEFHTPAHPKAFPRLNQVQYQDPYPFFSPHFPDFLWMMHKRGKPTINRLLLDVASVLTDGLESDLKEENEAQQAALGVARWFYVKSAHWAYELEWRALSSGPGPMRFTKRSLKGIIVGCVNTEANLKLVREAVKGRRPKIALYKAIKKPREFGLEVVPAE